MDEPKPGSADELATLAPGATRVPLKSGGAVTVRPLSIVEIGRIVKQLSPLIDAYDPLGSPLQLLEDHAEQVVTLAAAASGTDEAFMRDLPAGDFLRIGVKTLEANADFLEQMADLFTGETGRRLARMFGNSGGPMSSSDSPSTVSPTP